LSSARQAGILDMGQPVGRSNRDDKSLDKVAGDVLDSLLEGCQVIGFDWKYLYVNDAGAAQGRRTKKQLIGRTMMECYPGIDGTPMFDALRRCMTERARDRMENEFTFPDGSKGSFELRFVPVPEGVCILSLDTTAKKHTETELARSEAQLRHVQKMEAVGRLAGGVAHDFNNLLSIILSYTSLILGDLKGDDPLRADLKEIRIAGERAAGVTRQLLAFSRQQVLQRKILDLNQVVAGMEKMIARLLGADVELTLLPASGLGSVSGDPGQIEQVVMNLVVNARDAMPRGGKLTIQTNNVSLDEHYADDRLGIVPGPYVMLAVTDTGVGMNSETQARVFEPFFTTKDRGKGTGLGLSTAFGIVKQSRGHIWVYSEPAKGTTFKVYFPRIKAQAEPILSQPPIPEGVRGSETILLVEDDDQVRAVARGILRRGGYVVLDAPGAGEALLVSEQHGAKIHLLVTDVVLPRMNGPQLAERLHASRPAMKTLFMSGYTDDAMMQHGVLDSGVAFLQKPLTPDTLIRAVREALSLKATGA
jgi:two-component system cell cycle sensor histidine kinase/response regulator CckA